MDFRGFLNDVKDRDRHKDKARQKKKTASSLDTQKGVEVKEPPRKIPATSYAIPELISKEYNGQGSYLRYSDPHSQMSGISLDEERPPDATSEKELGNEYFKQKKFNEAVNCYSRSIALSPSAVAFSNRALAYLKLKRFEEAENDCTEALSLDDRYVKAYSRRATARKELGKLRLSLEDCDFAVRLEPNNQELRKQYSEMKALCEKERTATAGGKTFSVVKEPVQKSIATNDKNRVQLLDEPSEVASINSSVENHKKQHTPNGKNELGVSMQDVANRAASRVKATAGKNMNIPKSAYQFEVSWRALSDDSNLQAQLLKAIEPSALPQIFKNALSAPILVDIVRCTASFFKEETELAINILDNLTKVPRFDMVVMCLSSVDRADLGRLWDEVFNGEGIEMEQYEVLKRLKKSYCTRDWQTLGTWTEEMLPVR